MTVRHRGALAAMAAGAALTVAALVAVAARPAADVGADEVTALADTAPSAAGGRSPVPVRKGALPTGAAVVPPVGLRIPTIGVTATVAAVGINPQTSEFEVPPSVDQVGWYRYGPGLAAPAGSVVIAGHVDSSTQGEGAFFRLRELDQGDRLIVTGSDGQERTYRVIAREEYQKTRIPLDRYFARDGDRRLTLITCGGPFDADTRRYRDNLVVTAVPA
ncbi:class F sortase [Salinispora cortesiana]|uniref:class F sortase n=1 Tax=Salinispora cortesiana TaxID=1305843 RepID=UPI00040BBA44|nr:class F sortase [Salinispora cortesiana]